MGGSVDVDRRIANTHVGYPASYAVSTTTDDEIVAKNHGVSRCQQVSLSNKTHQSKKSTLARYCGSKRCFPALSAP